MMKLLCTALVLTLFCVQVIDAQFISALVLGRLLGGGNFLGGGGGGGFQQPATFYYPNFLSGPPPMHRGNFYGWNLKVCY